jgi:FMN phosphatase YigB (HAD superfamily)
VGYRKPHRAVFEEALRRLAVLPEEALVVGDSDGVDVLGRRASGYGKRPEAQ